MCDDYKFDKTMAILNRELDSRNPVQELINIFECLIELINYPDNDFAWSIWDNSSEASNKLQNIIILLKSGDLPNKDDITFLFLPTGSLQEVSISSGWGDIFIKIADKYDFIESLVW